MNMRMTERGTVFLTLCRPATWKDVIRSPMRCWRHTSFYVLLHVIYMSLSAGLTHLSLQGYWQLDAGCLGLKLRTNRPVLTPYFRTIRLQQRDHSFRYSLCFPSAAIMALRSNVLQEDDILCEMWIHVQISLIIVTTKVWTVAVISPQLVQVNNCDLRLGHWPHNFRTHFSSHYE
jgi:hypothetical protein